MSFRACLFECSCVIYCVIIVSIHISTRSRERDRFLTQAYAHTHDAGSIAVLDCDAIERIAPKGVNFMYFITMLSTVNTKYAKFYFFQIELRITEDELIIRVHLVNRSKSSTLVFNLFQLIIILHMLHTFCRI